MTLQRRTILTMIGWPNDEASGPIQSLTGLADALAGIYDFKVIARERKFAKPVGEPKPPGWSKYRSLDRYWCSTSRFGPKNFAALIRNTPHDVLILNGFFDPEFTIPALILRRLGLIPRRPTILSPRGEFSAGTAAMRKLHKKIYLYAARCLGLLDGVWFHATSVGEAVDVQLHVPWRRKVVIAPNIRLLGDWQPSSNEAVADAPLRLIYLSRVDRKKNLDFALNVLRSTKGSIEFDIYGPVNDEAYWRVCQSIIAEMPDNVHVRYRGVIANAAVPTLLAGYDAFFLPTDGENFGHAIFDALAVGLPVLISDQTPWRDLERLQAGWSLPLGQQNLFVHAIDNLRKMGAIDRDKLRRGARRLAQAFVAESDAVGQTLKMLELVIADAGSSN